MASSIELLEAVTPETTDATTITSSAVAPSGGWASLDRVVLVVGASLFTGPGLPTGSGGGGTFGTDNDDLYSSGQRRATILGADASAFSGTQAFTATWPANVGNRYMFVLCVREVDDASPIESAQDDGDAGDTGDTESTITLSPSPTSGNPRISAIMTNQNTTEVVGTWTLDAGWESDAGPQTSMNVQWSLTESNPSWDWDPTTATCTHLYVEYAHKDPGGAPQSITTTAAAESETAVAVTVVQATSWQRGREYDIDLDTRTVTIQSGPE